MLYLTKSGIEAAGGCEYTLPDATFCLIVLCSFTIVLLSALVHPTFRTSPHAAAGLSDYDMILTSIICAIQNKYINILNMSSIIHVRMYALSFL